jgi:EmrB/QacA subfamily drug resistance transporter
MPQRRAILALIMCVQLMSAVDITVMTMALPRIQAALGFSPAGLSWVLNGYTLAFGGLLLLGGRLGDILGRRRALIIGVSVFTAASLAGGLAQASWLLLAARALQGVGAALSAPSTLALITSNFPEGPERDRALGIFVTASGFGFAGGLVLGGLITDAISWRWVLLINVPIGLLVVLLAPRLIPRSSRVHGRFDMAGALTATAGMTTLVYGFVHPWSTPENVTAFVAGLVLLGLFVRIESRHEQPIVDLRLFADRTRSGGYAAFLMLGAAMFGMFFFMTQFVQGVLGMRPIEAGIAFLPSAVTMLAVPQVTPWLVTRFGGRPVIITGLSFVTAGMLWLTQVSGETGYFGGVLGPMVLFGTGVGLANPPLTGVILARVEQTDIGAASGVLQSVGQIGGSVGTAVLVTVFGSATAGGESMAEGIGTACIAGSVFAAVAVLLVAATGNVVARK